MCALDKMYDDLKSLEGKTKASEFEHKALVYAEKIGVYEYKVNGSLMEY